MVQVLVLRRWWLKLYDWTQISGVAIVFSTVCCPVPFLCAFVVLVLMYNLCKNKRVKHTKKSWSMILQLWTWTIPWDFLSEISLISLNVELHIYIVIHTTQLSALYISILIQALSQLGIFCFTHLPVLLSLVLRLFLGHAVYTLLLSCIYREFKMEQEGISMWFV